jgi:3-hydroxyacyl-CoA dehydrogenase/enoyl-CoA hydratase/3-hydroxybutyryl-CoA epimerase
MDGAARRIRWFAKIAFPGSGRCPTLFISMGELNKGSGARACSGERIKQLGILGAGFMGAGIAYVTASAGMR